ncbi:hypothetical protein EDD18DRAFT_1194719 [Armillaria luteobubalina]|uniref:Uncharacterized protein n=1 Tax=Armillaria luteobubalina TaxID=153913 RepID=A0AA39PLS6_9AGAR|nr:hypothetical protein EDD18DRAFT_1194719 [Armillaria luteobubalina]
MQDFRRVLSIPILSVSITLQARQCRTMIPAQSSASKLYRHCLTPSSLFLLVTPRPVLSNIWCLLPFPKYSVSHYIKKLWKQKSWEWYRHRASSTCR